MAYATIADGMSAGDLREFEEKIGMRADPEKIALAELKAYQEAQGMKFENPDAPVAAPLGSQDEEVPGSWMGDARGRQ